MKKSRMWTPPQRVWKSGCWVNARSEVMYSSGMEKRGGRGRGCGGGVNILQVGGGLVGEGLGGKIKFEGLGGGCEGNEQNGD